jgi:hypothetical protein
MGGTDDNTLWNYSRGDGNVSSVRNMNELIVKMERVTMIGKGRQNLTCFLN